MKYYAVYQYKNQPFKRNDTCITIDKNKQIHSSIPRDVQYNSLKVTRNLMRAWLYLNISPRWKTKIYEI